MAKTRAVSPESLCVHNTLGFALLATIPEASFTELFCTLPFELPEVKLGAALQKGRPTVSDNAATNHRPAMVRS